MQIISSIDTFPTETKTIVTVGSFDGIHLGHRAIFKQLTKEAEQRNLTSVILTFEPHPQQVLHPEKTLTRLNTLEQKTALIAQEKIDYLIIHPFTLAFSQLSPENFVQNILLEKLHAKAIIMGPNHTFGKNHSGNHQSIQHYCEQHGCEIIEIPELILHDCAVRSTLIRQLITNKEFEAASELLGYSL